MVFKHSLLYHLSHTILIITRHHNHHHYNTRLILISSSSPLHLLSLANQSTLSFSFTLAFSSLYLFFLNILLVAETLPFRFHVISLLLSIQYWKESWRVSLDEILYLSRISNKINWTISNFNIDDVCKYEHIKYFFKLKKHINYKTKQNRKKNTKHYTYN